MRPLTPKPFLQGMSGRETRSNGSNIKTDSALSHNFNGKAPNTPAIRDITTIIEKGRMHSNLKMNAL